MCRERFVEELESYSAQVEEFTTFGELTDLSKYLKKAQALNAKLELASDKVQQDFITQKYMTRETVEVISNV